SWFGRPLWDMAPGDADAYFGEVLRAAPSGTRLARAQALKTYFEFVGLRHKVEIHQMTGRVVECPIIDSISNTTWPDSTSAAVRGNVITGSGRTGRKATYRQRRFIPGHSVSPHRSGRSPQ
ncbi:MAG: hypothetical protein WBF76_07445, partial [Pseudonocardiaceae bacterium]